MTPVGYTHVSQHKPMINYLLDTCRSDLVLGIQDVSCLIDKNRKNIKLMEFIF